ncbi:MAG: lactate utilization protein [Lachnospiraceae bacterium]|nr:lactate utilization protein [Lachnospiraceae bacterium]
MSKPVKDAFACLAKGIIKNLEARNMEGYYCEDSKACVEKILSLMPAGSIVSWGGSMSISECGLMDAIRQKDYVLIDRDTATTPEEKREIYAKTVMADYYLMSSNAITMEGELMNIDGFGNRVACLITGPSNVCVIVGRNKVVEDIEYAESRIRNVASPANTQRLNKQTPCAFTGRCGDCLSPDCICNQFVITRRSGIKGRIKVFLVNEELGY